MKDGADKGYWEALERGVVAIQHCPGCGTWHWPAVWRCGECGQWSPPWTDVALEGRVFSWQTTAYRFGGTEAIELPYVTVLGELPHAGGRRLLGNCPEDASRLTVGAPLRGQIKQRSIDGQLFPYIEWQLA